MSTVSRPTSRRTSGSRQRAATEGSWAHLSYEELTALAEGCGVRVVEHPLPQLFQGLYSEERGMILLDTHIREWQRRVTLAHEMVHAEYHDSACEASPGSRAERRARTLSALRLIDPVEYKAAELLFSGSPYGIACELGVTVQCVREYQAWLDERKASGELSRQLIEP